MEYRPSFRYGPRLAVIAGASLAAFALYGYYSYVTLAQVKVNGPVYQRIAQSNDILAEAMPPDLYLGEAYLTAYGLIDATPAETESRSRAMRALLGRFRDRDEYWSGALRDPALKSALEVEVCYPGRAVATLLEKEFLPAVRSGDKAEARRLLSGPLRAEFERHRAGTDSLARLAAERNRQDEGDVAAMIHRRMVGQLAIGLALVMALAAACFRIVWKCEMRVKRQVYGMLTGDTPMSPDIRDKVMWN